MSESLGREEDGEGEQVRGLQGWLSRISKEEDMSYL